MSTENADAPDLGPMGRIMVENHLHNIAHACTRLSDYLPAERDALAEIEASAAAIARRGKFAFRASLGADHQSH